MTSSKLGLRLIGGMAILMTMLVIRFFFYPEPACACTSPETVCMQNLKEIGTATALYCNDYDNRLPKADLWIDSLQTYSQRESMYQDREGIKKGSYGYAFRKSASTVGFDEIKNPPEFIVVFDSSLMGRDAAGELWSLPRPGRHKGSDNVCFADGHAKRLSLSDESSPEDESPFQKALKADDNAGP